DDARRLGVLLKDRVLTGDLDTDVVPAIGTVRNHRDNARLCRRNDGQEHQEQCSEPGSSHVGPPRLAISGELAWMCYRAKARALGSERTLVRVRDLVRAYHVCNLVTRAEDPF